MSRIAISGASGLIGSALVASFDSRRDEVTRLVRRRPQSSNEIQWDPMREIPPQLVSSFDVVVHLSGESVAGRWTEAKKSRIRDSRIVSTQNLSGALASAERKPGVFICASAIGYYGNRGDEILTEESPSGSGFLAEVSRDWEAATVPASHCGIRVLNLRIGVVLSRDGGALKEMMLPFRLGLGGRIGSGRQWLSWIHIDDLVSAVWHVMRSEEAHGPVNITAPSPVTNAEFTRTLAKGLHRPAFIAIPGFAVRLAFGEFANEGLLSSARVEPKNLLASGFEFQFSDLGGALGNLLRSTRPI